MKICLGVWWSSSHILFDKKVVVTFTDLIDMKFGVLLLQLYLQDIWKYRRSTIWGLGLLKIFNFILLIIGIIIPFSYTVGILFSLHITFATLFNHCSLCILTALVISMLYSSAPHDLPICLVFTTHFTSSHDICGSSLWVSAASSFGISFLVSS